MKRREKKPKAPFRRGARLENPGGYRALKVIACESSRCRACEGTGILWMIRVRNQRGIFETPLDSIRKGGYVVVRAQKEEPDADSSSGE